MPLCPSQIPSVHLSPASLRPLRPGMTERGTHANAPNGRSVDQQISNDVHLLYCSQKPSPPLHLPHRWTSSAFMSFLMSTTLEAEILHAASRALLHVETTLPPASRYPHNLIQHAQDYISRLLLVFTERLVSEARSFNFFDAQHSLASVSVQPGTNEITLPTWMSQEVSKWLVNGL